MNVILVIIFFILVVWFEVPALLKKEYHYELAVFLVFLFPVLILSILQAGDAKLPLILPAIETIMKPLLSLLGLI